jgi:hypothetical protein
MADILKAEGLVLTATYSNGDVFPFACAKSSTINVSRDFIELAPKTSGYFREYIIGRTGFTISGSGLIKLIQPYMNAFPFFDEFMLNIDTTFKAYLDMIDNQNNYKVYKFDCIMQDLSLDSTIGSAPTYDYTLQGTGPIELINVVDQDVVASGVITGRDPDDFKLTAVGYQGKWYFNYTVTEPTPGTFVISLGSGLNGVTVTASYLAL